MPFVCYVCERAHFVRILNSDKAQLHTSASMRSDRDGCVQGREASASE